MSHLTNCNINSKVRGMSAQQTIHTLSCWGLSIRHSLFHMPESVNMASLTVVSWIINHLYSILYIVRISSLQLYCFSEARHSLIMLPSVAFTIKCKSLSHDHVTSAHFIFSFSNVIILFFRKKVVRRAVDLKVV